MYWTMALKTFAVSLVGVFVPAFLYKLGYSFQSIILYFLIRELAELVMVLPTSAAMRWFGIKQTYTAGSLLTLAGLLMLYKLPTNPHLFGYTALVEGIAISLFFLPYHYMFSAAVTRKSGGRQVGLMDIIVCIVAAIGPLVGGLLASRYGLQAVLLIAIGFVVLALVPLFKGAKKERLQVFSYVKPFAMLKSRDSMSNMGFGVTEMVATIIWPLFIFWVVKSYATVGIIISLSMVLIVLLDWVAGKLTDNGGKSKLLRAGAVSSAVVHGVRILATGFGSITLINLASDITHTLFRVPWTREFYAHAGVKQRGTYIAAMELAVCVGRTGLWAVLYIGAAYVNQKNFMLGAFLLGAIGSLFVPSIAASKSRRRPVRA